MGKPMLQYLELRHLDFLDAEERGLAFEETARAAHRFIDNFLSPEGFAAVAMLRSPGLLAWLLGNSQRAMVWMTSLTEARKERSRLLRGLQKGFDALFVLSVPAAQVREWFGSGYEPKNGDWSPIAENSEPVAYIDEKLLRQHVMTMVLEPGQCGCLVAHDRDPVYLIRTKSAAI